jgi:hypothetical protein
MSPTLPNQQADPTAVTKAPPAAFDGTTGPNVPKSGQSDRTYGGSWKTSCLGVCFSYPGVCCYAEFCLCCLLCTQRSQLMAHHTPPLTEYSCCMDRAGGEYMSKYCRCGGPYPMNSNSAQCCLCWETLCCFFLTVPAHRREISDQYGVKMGKEEWVAHALACISWIPVFGLAGGFLLSWAAICCYACLAAQQQVEIDAPAGPARQSMQ